MSQHIVEFENWCNKCKYYKKDEEDNPCYLCLDEPVNEDSKRPVYYVEDTIKKKEKKNARQR